MKILTYNILQGGAYWSHRGGVVHAWKRFDLVGGMPPSAGRSGEGKETSCDLPRSIRGSS